MDPEALRESESIQCDFSGPTNSLGWPRSQKRHTLMSWCRRKIIISTYGMYLLRSDLPKLVYWKWTRWSKGQVRGKRFCVVSLSQDNDEISLLEKGVLRSLCIWGNEDRTYCRVCGTNENTYIKRGFIPKAVSVHSTVLWPCYSFTLGKTRWLTGHSNPIRLWFLVFFKLVESETFPNVTVYISKSLIKNRYR